MANTFELYTVNVDVPLKDTSSVAKILDKYNYQVNKELYEKLDSDGIPIVYNFLYKYAREIKDKRVVTVSLDPAISASTISASCEKSMIIEPDTKSGKPRYISNTKILYFDSSPDLDDNTETNMMSLSKKIVTNLMCLSSIGDSEDATFTKHNLVVDPNQIIYFGLNENVMTDYDKAMIEKFGFRNYTLQRIKKIGIDRIIKSVIDDISDNPVHIVFDMSVFDISIAPCVIRNNPHNIKADALDGLNLDDMILLCNELSSLNIIGMDVTGFDLRSSENKLISKENAQLMERVTCETARMLVAKINKIPEKRINIFNENSRFLIWRPVDAENNSDAGIGWYILRGVPLDTREDILSKIEDGEIQSITIELDDSDDNLENTKDILVASTTIQEQQEKSFYMSYSYLDCVLYPSEKIDMTFELLNTENNKNSKVLV